MIPRILIIEDEVRSAKLLKAYLEKAGFRADTAFDGQSGLRSARELNPDLILLDLMLPQMDGEEVCSTLNSESTVPIIMLTAKGSREDRINGFDYGADDYIVKPYDPDEVIARIRAVLRRSGGFHTEELVCGPIKANIAEESVSINGIPVELTHAQFSVFYALLRNRGAVLSRSSLIEQAFGNSFDAFDRAIDTHIRRLRRVIHSEGFAPIKTVYGGGYKLECDSD